MQYKRLAVVQHTLFILETRLLHTISMMRLQRSLSTSYWPARTDVPLLDVALGELLTRLASQHPHRVAIIEGVREPALRRRWTYQELLQTAHDVAQALLSRFEPGEKIAIWSPNCAEWLLLQHGAALAGLVVVTINPAYLARELEYALSTAEVAGVFHVDRYRATDTAAVLNSVRPGLPHLRETISFRQWNDFLASGHGLKRDLPTVRPTDVAQIQFTSGTTGAPKGARLHHRGLINAARFGAMRVNFPQGGVWAAAMPFFHVGGSSGSHMGALSHSGTFVLQPTFDAGSMLELIETEGVHHIHAVPAMLRAMLDHRTLPERNLHTLQSVMSGGSNVSADLIQRVCSTFKCRFSTNFGQTELSGVIAQTFPDDPNEQHAHTVGQPAPCMEVKVADPNTGEVRPLGVPGEIWARGYQTMVGYFNLRPEAEDALTADGWVRTGDEGIMDAAGYLRISGRLKDAIIRGGENIYPREIEDVLALHPDIAESCVLGMPDEQWGEVVAAVVRIRDGRQRPAPLTLFQYCRGQLSAYKTPVIWFYTDSMPLTASGKVRKFRVRELIQQGQLKPEPFERPVTQRVEETHPSLPG